MVTGCGEAAAEKSKMVGCKVEVTEVPLYLFLEGHKQITMCVHDRYHYLNVTDLFSLLGVCFCVFRTTFQSRWWWSLS